MVKGNSLKAKAGASLKMRDGTPLKALNTPGGKYKKDNWL